VAIAGSGVWLARTIRLYRDRDLRLSPFRLAEKAKAMPQSRRVEQQNHFWVHTATSFPSASFDVIWALKRGACQTRQTFLQEAYRLLKPKCDPWPVYLRDALRDPNLGNTQLLQPWLEVGYAQSTTWPAPIER